MRTLRRTGLTLAATVVGLSAVLAGAGTASATAAAPQSPFAAQGRGAGLSSTQITGLQKEVDAFIATSGGRQVALNRVQLSEGSAVVLTVPGESRARDLTGARAGAFAPGNCGDKNFCAYKGANYTGYEFTMWQCKTWELPGDGWGRGGSWYNNQTPGTRAVMYGKHMQWVYTTPRAPFGDPHGNWAPVWFIKNC
ncbi:peptidase inhibitor family I36 protein [Kitasatospora aureofaciens]|uniref:peptidase inhibitor family I36 protein n=1 Tax=Kitasatospora aureofaciens TaxID=1894 RepID=UPI001C47BD6B|nr:peptidase inhibitor family I36 protein [Kitasatospora aureofaciens]MBV6700370.1 hypothetical protein [Kitasatospora aureofaciens]